MPVDTVAGTKLWRLRVANVWVVTARRMSYCSNILTVATLGLRLLTQMLAQHCGVWEWPMFVRLLRAECFTAVTFWQWLQYVYFCWHSYSHKSVSFRVANVWMVTASGMSYCSNILTVATLGLCLLTQLLAQQCGVWEWPMFGWLLRAEWVTAVIFWQWLL